MNIAWEFYFVFNTVEPWYSNSLPLKQFGTRTVYVQYSTVCSALKQTRSPTSQFTSNCRSVHTTTRLLYIFLHFLGYLFIFLV